MVITFFANDFSTDGGTDDPARMEVEDKAYTSKIWPTSERLSDLVEH